MSYRLELSPESLRQIEKQQIWYEADPLRGGAEIAARWLDGLELETQSILTNPQRYPFAPENGKWMKKHVIRQCVYRPWKTKSGWRLLYTINESKKLVTILDIRHESRRWLHDS